MYCNCIFEDVKSKIYDFLDGKQRVTTIVKFLKDEFPLVNIPTFEDEEGNEQDFNGLVYSQLPEEVQDTIKTYSLTVYYYENMDQEDAEEMFRRLNNGKSLTAIELTRANAASGDKIRRMASHDLFDLALSEKSLASYANEDVVIKTWVLLYSNKKSFETKYIRPVMKESVITEDQMEEINNIFDEFLSVCKDLQKNKPKIAKKILGKNHMISIMPIMQKAVRDNIDLKVVKEWIVDFFGTETRDISVNSRYNEFAKGRIAVTEEAVNIRTRILNDSFSEFFMPE